MSYQTYRATGSVYAAVRYMARIVIRKVPILIRQARQIAHRGDIAAGISATRKAGDDTPVIAVAVSGGIGDYIVAGRFLRDLLAAVGDCHLDLYVNHPGVARWVFTPLPQIRACYDDAAWAGAQHHYDAALRIGHYVGVDHTTPQLRPALAQIIDNIRKFASKIQVFIDNQPLMDGFLAQTATFANLSRSTFPHHIAGIPYGGDAYAVPTTTRSDLPHQDYITVHNGFDAGFVVSGQTATKCYPHFGAVIRLLKQQWPDLRFVQIGTSTSTPIPGVDIGLLGQTTLPEAAGLIAGARLHLDNESGFVHLARSLGTDACVVFGPTPSAYFGYGSNINIDPVFCGGCWSITETWMSQCPRGFPTARCMTEQPAAVVVAAVDRYLRQAEPL